jgi:hypothetical protein
MTITVGTPHVRKAMDERPEDAAVAAERIAQGELLEVVFAPVDEKEFSERIRNPAGGRAT